MNIPGAEVAMLSEGENDDCCLRGRGVNRMSNFFFLASRRSRCQPTRLAQETRRLGERTRGGLVRQTLSGYNAGGRPAYGYERHAVFSETECDVDGRPKRIGVKLIPDSKTASQVKRIFLLFVQGYGYHKIARILNEAGIPTRDAGTTRNGRINDGTWALGQHNRPRHC